MTTTRYSMLALVTASLIHLIAGQDTCLFCLGSPLPTPSEIVASVNQTCLELQTDANTNDTSMTCNDFQDLYSDTCCGRQIEPLPPGYVDCPICADPTHTPQDPSAVFVAGLLTLSCQVAYLDFDTLKLPESNCTFWQSTGTDLCLCGNSTPPTNNDCTLCQGGGALPFPMREVVPGRLCTQVQADAKRDVLERCDLWQDTFGVYCGCGNQDPIDEPICRICDKLLPKPQELVDLVTLDGDEISSSCGELEFDANEAGAASCAEFQEFYGGVCCQFTDPPAVETQPPEDGAFGLVRYECSSVAGLVALVMLWNM
jgi:hypothetical protein